MKYTRFEKSAFVVMFAILMVAMVVMVQAQYPTSSPQKTAEPKKTTTQTTEKKDTVTPATEKTDMATPAAEGKKMAAPAGRHMTATLTATLVDAEKKAAQKAATVQVKTTGIRLIDPAMVKEMPKAGQGHLHYQVDGGPVIATTATKLSFHELSSGPHKIMVMLAGNDHNPLGPQQTLEVTVP